MLLWGVACWAFFQYAYPCHLFYQEQNQLFLLTPEYVGSYFPERGGVARLVGDFLTQFYYYRYAGAVILALCLLATVGLWHLAFRRLGVHRLLSLTVSLLAGTLLVVGSFSETFRLWSVVAVAGWALLLVVATLPRRRWQQALLFLLCLPLGYRLFYLPQMPRLQAPNLDLEKVLATDCEYYFGNYNRVVDMVKGEQRPLTDQLFYYNLVQAQRGALPDHLLDFYPNELGTFQHIGPDAPLLRIKSINELYWTLGDMTYTERAAMMACVFSAENRNVRMIRRLAECSLVRGDSVAAQKFLGLLRHTVAHRRWAATAPRSPLYAAKQRLANTQDTIAIGDNAHFIMMQLLDSNGDNTPCLDYMLCSLLLLKDMQGFKRDYDRYCSQRPRPKRLYQEALCICLAATNAPAEEWEKYIVSRDVITRFGQYSRQRGSRQFKDTYWYYYDKITAPKI